jgi:hypothetical protein
MEENDLVVEMKQVEKRGAQIIRESNMLIVIVILY